MKTIDEVFKRLLIYTLVLEHNLHGLVIVGILLFYRMKKLNPNMKIANLMFQLLSTLLVTSLVQAQNQTGFISLDCGLLPIDMIYTEKRTNLTYTSDASYINSGVSGSIKSQYIPNYQQQLWSLRSFPEGIRNCYQFNLTKGQRYLIRAGFLYGDYDGLDESPSFDMYLGPNLWSSVNIKKSSVSSSWDITHVLTSNHLQVCLVKTGTTTPFISSLGIRPLPSDIYNTKSGSLVNMWREYHTTNLDGFIRFDEDIYDRGWNPYFEDDWTQISNTGNIYSKDIFNPPELALKHAATPKNGSQPLNYTIYDDEITGNQVYVYLHFAELELLQSNESRQFTITINGGRDGNSGYLDQPFTPSFLSVKTISSKTAIKFVDRKIEILLRKTDNSTHPPLLNAIEVYSVIQFPQLETNSNEVDAIMNLQSVYEVNKVSWQGDPCAPKAYIWDGLNCSYPLNDSSQITSLNLSSSGLTGYIAPGIANLTELVNLDLSNNNLTGEVPQFLAQLEFLKFLNLSSNQLDGPIPSALLENKKKGSLTFSYGGNPVLCKSYSCDEKVPIVNKPKSIIPVVAAVASFIGVAALLTTFFIVQKRRNAIYQGTLPGLEIKGRRFSYSEVFKITNNFEKVLGKGGYGMVYHGFLDGAQVAVKMLSQSSAQGYKEFKAEVELLLRVHHRNLVSLVGYCDEGDNMSLIYEFMANGDLKEYLSGKRGNNTLSWRERLKIAAEAAQGLEYLHHGCTPPIVHRDVKATNILINEHLLAKLGDFGLSRSFSADGETHVSTMVAGTPGYLDPDYYRTNWLTEKSDVYGFGVALMEIIVNQPVIDNTRESPHITDWVSMILAKGDIKSIIDPKLEGDYDTNNVWKAIEVAMNCVNPSANRRPTMTYVVAELNECLAAETARKEGSQEMEPKRSIEVTLSFGNANGPGAK